MAGEGSYDYTTGLTPREWAWEFLRRNPAFQCDVIAASQQANTLSHRSSLDVVTSAGDLSRRGVRFRRVLWAQFVRILVSAMVRSCAAGHCRTAVCMVGDSAVRALCIAMSCDGPAGARQGSACSSSQCGAYAPARRLWRRYLAPCLPQYRGNLAINAFEAPPEGTRVPQCSKFGSTPACPLVFSPERHGPRLTFVLRALDGSLAGASHRELAEALVGQRRVHADWRDPRDHLRDRIRRAVSRGRALMNGGYRDFLLYKVTVRPVRQPANSSELNPSPPIGPLDMAANSLRGRSG
ncbi:DUF2285 domain-containing protein [Mesorhizobium sp.]|uniref:DUF2285 domain-containing protein n=2 Tax=unclassified Mesorhizobium TaxID=325217 RepID=UPI0026C712DC